MTDPSLEQAPSALEGDGLDRALAALRSFALVGRELIADERNKTITTDAIRLRDLPDWLERVDV